METTLKHIKKIIVVAPGGATTGGPEALHQLVHELRFLGKSAFISYLPSNRQFETPVPYCKYNTPQHRLADEVGNMIILPEVCTSLATKLKFAHCGIWWLSVDNYLNTPYDGCTKYLPNPTLFQKPSQYPWWYWRAVLRGARSYKENLSKGRTIPLHAMGNLTHFAQSYYAEQFLANMGLSGHPLSDYLSEHHFSDLPQSKQDIIAYNPAKGYRIVLSLIKRFPNFHFVPIQNMQPAEVSVLLHKAKVYIDFGNHPGKDRLPREAVINGCCIIVSPFGSAAFTEDVPIPRNYQLMPFAPDFYNHFEALINDVMCHHSRHKQNFIAWHEKINDERQQFQKQITTIFC